MERTNRSQTQRLRRWVWLAPMAVAAALLLPQSIFAQVEQSATELREAAETGNLAAIALLLKKGATVDAMDIYGFHPVARAAEFGQNKAVLLLLAHGAKINATDNLEKQTALSVSADMGHANTVALLLAHGANPNSVDTSGLTPLCWACAYGNPKTVQALVAHGAAVNFQDKHGGTALMIAAGDNAVLTAAPGNLETVKILIRAGANPALKDADGRTALDIARSNRQTAIVAYLLKPPDLEANATPRARRSKYADPLDPRRHPRPR